MLDRREFLKRCYKIGGVAAIIGLGISAVEDAMGWGILPAVVGGGKISLYDAWNETDEAGWGDSANTVNGFMEALNAGDDETVQGGGLTGADLVWTEFGTLPGATGSPLTRAFDTSYSMTMTQACAEVTKSKTWCIIFKLLDFTETGEGTFMRLSKGDNDIILQLSTNARYIQARFTASSSGYTSAAAPTSGTVYVAIQANGVDDVICGWSTSKIVRWSDIPSTQKKTISGVKGDASALTYIATQQYIGTQYEPKSNPAYNFTAKVQYIIISKSAIILP